MSPLSDGEKVTVTIKVPEELEPKPMLCKIVLRDAGGRPEQLDGHSGHEVELVRLKHGRPGRSKLAPTVRITTKQLAVQKSL